jgi:hypothetical protein
MFIQYIYFAQVGELTITNFLIIKNTVGVQYQFFNMKYFCLIIVYFIFMLLLVSLIDF